MKAIYEVCAPAKLNLFLHVTGQRSDGYHTLQSVFMLIDWCDVLSFELRSDGRISRSDAVTIPCVDALPAEDLTVRAARTLRAAAASGQPALGVHIHLEKRIPAQAGMGGGSSDAASTLLALNRLWNLNLPRLKLMEIGLGLGADVPFFLGGHNALVEGIGEQISPIEVPNSRFVVVKPQGGLETAQIFRHPDLPRSNTPAIMMGFAANPFAFGRNDLQGVAQTLCPQVGQGLEWLAAQGLHGRMTGSGSAVFARLEDSDGRSFQSADAAAMAGFEVRMCRNLPHHPLKAWAADPTGD